MLHKETVTTGTLDLIKFDLISHRYTQIKPLLTVEGIRMLSLHDIAAMKVNAIVGNGTGIKDFLDIYDLLKKMPYQDIIEAYLQKYPDVNAGVAKASMLYHEDIDFTISVTLLKEKVKWKHVGKSIKTAIAGYEKEKQKKRLKSTKQG